MSFKRAKKLPTLKPPRLSICETVGGFFKVEIHGADELRDGPRNFSVMYIGMAWTKDEALAQARDWFASLKDTCPVARPLLL